MVTVFHCTDIVWLEFFESLIEVRDIPGTATEYLAQSSDRLDGGYQLKKQYELDDTHLHPSYTNLIEKALK